VRKPKLHKLARGFTRVECKQSDTAYMKAGICCWTVSTNRTFLHILLTFVVYVLAKTVPRERRAAAKAELKIK
jgi:hypothetical protein